MTTDFRRRPLGYSPVSVARYIVHQQNLHADQVAQLQAELTAAQAATSAMLEQIREAQARLWESVAHSQDLTRQALAHLTGATRTILSFREQNAVVENALTAEIERLKAAQRQLEELQSRFGADMDGLVRRYRDQAESLRPRLPGGEPLKTNPSEQRTPAFLRKSASP